jgi:hypothetical protein
MAVPVEESQFEPFDRMTPLGSCRLAHAAPIAEQAHLIERTAMTTSFITPMAND